MMMTGLVFIDVGSNVNPIRNKQGSKVDNMDRSDGPFQTRSETNGLRSFLTFKEAFDLTMILLFGNYRFQLETKELG